jgi:hypothetical protein
MLFPFSRIFPGMAHRFGHKFPQQCNFVSMVIGNKLPEDYWMNIDPEQFREQEYYYNLIRFEGVEGGSYGIMDELRDFKKLIRIIGDTVVKEEKEFRILEKSADPDGPFPSEQMLGAWHKKMYRQFTYKSLMLLIQTTFETGMVTFYNILVADGRLTDNVRKKNVLDLLRALKGLDTTLPALIDPVRGFNFIRNKMAHMDGYYKDPDTDIDAFKKLQKNRSDIIIKKLTSPRGKHTHEMTITRSTVLTDYLDIIGKVFQGLISGAKELPYSSVTPKPSFWKKVLNLILTLFRWIGKYLISKRRK